MWTDERVDTLKKRWAEGKSAGEIAATEFAGAMSRNAVIGKVHRLGLATRSVPYRGAKAGRPRGGWQGNVSTPQRRALAIKSWDKRSKLDRHERATKTAEIKRILAAAVDRTEASVASMEPLPGAPLVTLMDLEPHHCRWMHDDRFCGCAKVPGTSYCEHHLRAAYTVYKPTGRPFSLMRKFALPAPEAMA